MWKQFSRYFILLFTKLWFGIPQLFHLYFCCILSPWPPPTSPLPEGVGIESKATPSQRRMVPEACWLLLRTKAKIEKTENSLWKKISFSYGEKILSTVDLPIPELKRLFYILVSIWFFGIYLLYNTFSIMPHLLYWFFNYATFFIMSHLVILY